jgi:bis(5'-nucleosyl)-tetraphosphatase (symmetrical)
LAHSGDRRLALYAIGDVQGCYRTLQRLLRRIHFDAARDRLWLVGDLVNRGPDSLAVLRWARRLGPRLTVVLGNHDLHLIGRSLGVRARKPRDTLDDVLFARDGRALVDWLRSRPLLHRDRRRLLVHAGLHPAWTPAQAAVLARGAETVLRGRRPEEAILAMRGELPRWGPGISRKDRLRLTVQTLTTLRTCRPSGHPADGFSGSPEDAPRGHMPWFDVPGRRSRGATVICGHWAALGLHIVRHKLIALDTGCVWGRELTAVRLDDGAVYQEPNAEDT